MAKKVVARLQTKEGKGLAKVVKAMRSPKTGAYVFKEQMMPVDAVKAFLAGKK